MSPKTLYAEKKLIAALKDSNFELLSNLLMDIVDFKRKVKSNVLNSLKYSIFC